MGSMLETVTVSRKVLHKATMPAVARIHTRISSYYGGLQVCRLTNKKNEAVSDDG